MKSVKLLAIFGLIASSFMIFIRVMNPTSIMIIIEGNIVEMSEIPHIYNSWDMAVISASCFVLGSSLIYLLLDGEDKRKSVRENWDDLLEKLSSDDEKEIVKLIIAEGGNHLPKSIS
jgi:hypothetical protein